ncbi:EamA family transporter [Haloechinothrix alba]|uniref:EamA family transporter n=1 Tax=Haloechinothrix alba TaxID=664784 RepID=UPI000B77924B|nr:DMT family transporter [Haloechinothrix alba]
MLSTFFFAVACPVAKALYSIGWTPGSVVLIRLAGASVLLLVPTLIALRGRWGEVRHHWRTIVTYGVVSMAGVQAFFFLALEHLSVAVAILLEMMGAPLIIVFWLWARTRQRPSTMTGIGVVVSLLGVVLVLFTVGAYLFGILGLRHLGATVGSFVNLTEVPFSAIAAWILLAEALTPLQLAGGVVILAGIVLVKWGDLKTKPGPPEQRTLSEQRPVTAPCRDARSGV